MGPAAERESTRLFLTAIGAILMALAGCSIPLHAIPSVGPTATEVRVASVLQIVTRIPKPTSTRAATVLPARRAAARPSALPAAARPPRAATPSRTPTRTPIPTLTPTVAWSPTPGQEASPVSRGATTDRAVAISYDAGADRGNAASLLAILRD